MAHTDDNSGDEITFYKGGKSKARKALERVGAYALAAEKELLVQHGTDGTQWGFYHSEAKRIQATGLENENKPAPVVEQPPVDPQAGATIVDLGMPTGSVIAPEDNPATGAEPETESDPAAAAGAFASLGTALQTHPVAAPAAPQRAASRTAYTVEKNRPHQNGVTRPSQGGLCRDVWDHCDDLQTKNDGVAPAAKDLRAWATEKGLNMNNTMIEYYQWRRFNGITGRTPKAAPAPATAATA